MQIVIEIPQEAYDTIDGLGSEIYELAADIREAMEAPFFLVGISDSELRLHLRQKNIKENAQKQEKT